MSLTLWWLTFVWLGLKQIDRLLDICSCHVAGLASNKKDLFN